MMLASSSSTWDSAAARRVVRVWTRALEPHAAGRHEDGSPVLGLGPTLDWSPSGSLFAASQVRCTHTRVTSAVADALAQAHRRRLRVVFFERNGLTHGELVLPDAEPEQVRA